MSISYENVDFWHWKLPSKLYAVLLHVQLSFATEGTPIGGGDNTDESIELYLGEIGEVNIEYDMEELLAVNGRLKFSVLDNASYIYNRLFSDDAAYADYTKAMGILLEYSSITAPYDGWIFQGGVAAETMDYDYRRKMLSAMAVQEHKFNSVLLYQDGEALNPLGYTTGAWHKLKDVIEALLGLVGYYPPTIVNNDWIFKGTTGGDPATVIDDVTFDELYVKTDDLFRNPDAGLETVGDLLRQLAFELGCYFGIFKSTMYFFKPVASTDESKQKLVNADDIADVKHGFLTPAPFVRVSSVYDFVAASVFSIGDSAYNGSANAIDRKAILLYTGDETNFQFNLMAIRGSVDYAIIGAKTPLTGVDYYQYCEAPARYWYTMRNTGNRIKTKEISLHGFEWDFLDEPVMDGIVYRILKLGTDFQKNLTTMTIVPIGLAT